MMKRFPLKIAAPMLASCTLTVVLAAFVEALDALLTAALALFAAFAMDQTGALLAEADRDIVVDEALRECSSSSCATIFA